MDAHSRVPTRSCFYAAPSTLLARTAGSQAVACYECARMQRVTAGMPIGMYTFSGRYTAEAFCRPGGNLHAMFGVAARWRDQHRAGLVLRDVRVQVHSARVAQWLDLGGVRPSPSAPPPIPPLACVPWPPSRGASDVVAVALRVRCTERGVRCRGLAIESGSERPGSDDLPT